MTESMTICGARNAELVGTKYTFLVAILARVLGRSQSLQRTTQGQTQIGRPSVGGKRKRAKVTTRGIKCGSKIMITLR
jgi:hypothetical protein